jgi:hypothetical protein
VVGAHRTVEAEVRDVAAASGGDQRRPTTGRPGLRTSRSGNGVEGANEWSIIAVVRRSSRWRRLARERLVVAGVGKEPDDVGA